AFPKVSFSEPESQVEAYEFVEITATVSSPDVIDPFTDAALEGSFGSTDGKRKWKVTGFCDSSDGSVFRIRKTLPSEESQKPVTFHFLFPSVLPNEPSRAASVNGSITSGEDTVAVISTNS